MTGFTHRVTSQVRGPALGEPGQVRSLLERGWVEDPTWLLRTVHELAHVRLNLTPVGEALALAELSLDLSVYDGLSTQADLGIVVEARDALSFALGLLAPWHEAIALGNEWDLDLSALPETPEHRWMAALLGAEQYDDRLWAARLSPNGAIRKQNTLDSSCYGPGHLMGHLLSRALLAYGHESVAEVLQRLECCVFYDLDLAKAILDLPGAVQSTDSVFAARDDIAKSFATATEHLLEVLEGDPSPDRDVSRDAESFQRRLRSCAASFTEPVKPPASLPTDPAFFRDAGRSIAHMSYSLRGFVGLGHAHLDLRTHDGQVVGSILGEEVLSFRDDHTFRAARQGTLEVGFCAHCGPASRAIRLSAAKAGTRSIAAGCTHIADGNRARISSVIVELAQAAATDLEAALRAKTDTSARPMMIRRVAATAAKDVIEAALDVSIELGGLSPFGVGTALNRDHTLRKALARLSIEYSATLTPSGRAQCPSVSKLATEQISELHARLLNATGLPLAVRDGSTMALIW